jgi:flavin-dependent dehydrogenase
MQQYDAVIVGAGPAGLSTAIELLRKGWQVLLLDKENFTASKSLRWFFRSRE